MNGMEMLFKSVMKSAGIEPQFFIDQISQLLRIAQSVDDRLRRIEERLDLQDAASNVQPIIDIEGNVINGDRS